MQWLSNVQNSQYELSTLSLPSDEQKVVPSQPQSAKVILVLFVFILHVYAVVNYYW